MEVPLLDIDETKNRKNHIKLDIKGNLIRCSIC